LASRLALPPWLARALKALMPRGLLGRSLLIVLVPLVVVQAVALQVFYGTHMNIVSRRLSAAIAGEVAIVIDALERAPEYQERVLAGAYDRLELRMRLVPGVLEPEHGRPPQLEILERSLVAALEERLRRPVALDWQSDSLSVVLRTPVGDGLLEVDVPRKRLFAGTLSLFVAWLVGSSLLLFGIAALFLRNQVRSIRRLARSMDAFGRGHESAPLRPSGATEVRQAASAFHVMQERVRRFLAQRTQMLAGVSHDLRTPLTRMRLEIEMSSMSDEARSAIDQDLAQVDRMIGQLTEYARAASVSPETVSDVSQVLTDLVEHDKARTSDKDGMIQAAITPNLRAIISEQNLARVIANLIENARRYGHAPGSVPMIDLKVQPAGMWVGVDVCDRGPGIPAEDIERLMRPFSRGDTARTGGTGTGLGLAIVDRLVRHAGGNVIVMNRPGGGLIVRLELVKA